MIEHPPHRDVHPDFAEAVRFWWKLGWISFGGTAAHIAILHEELVEKKRWISHDHFLHALSHCMLLPGPEAQQLTIYIGWKLHGKKGGIAAGVLFVLPSMFVLLALSLLYVRFGRLSWIAAMISALRPAVLAVVVLALFRVARRTLVAPLQWAVALGAFVSMTLLNVSLPLVICAVVILGLLTGRYCPGLLTHGQSAEAQSKFTRQSQGGWRQHLLPLVRIVSVGLVLWAIPLFLLSCMGRDFPFWRQLSLFFTKAAFVTVGGSYTVIPYVAHVAVMKYHWLDPSQMLDGFSLAETTPGPLIIVVAFVGFLAGFNHFHGSLLMGTIALVVTTFYTFLPCFLFVAAAAPWVERTHGQQSIESVLRMIPAIVVAAMLNLTVFLGRGALLAGEQLSVKELDGVAMAWFALSLFLLRRCNIGILAIVALSLVLGLARWAILRF
jgi:chromate transporter